MVGCTPTLNNLKGHYVVLEKNQTLNFNVNNNRTQYNNRTLFDARKVAGSATYKVEQYDTVLSFKFSLLIQSWKPSGFVIYFV